MQVITDEKHWLMKADPDVMEEKTLDSTYGDTGEWPTEWDGAVADPLQDPQEFLLNFPTLADHGVAAGTADGPSELDQSMSKPSLPRPISFFELPVKTSLSTRVDNLAVETALMRDFEQYIALRQ
jgi:hypothetical protein